MFKWILDRLKSKYVSVLKETEAQHRVDLIEKEVGALPQIECPLTHTFTPGLYIRELHVPKGALVITKIHKTTHPMVISKGSVSIWTEDKGVTRVSAPFTSITTPGTRRIFYTHEDTVWMTFHPTNKTDSPTLEEELVETRDVEYALNEYIKKELIS